MINHALCSIDVVDLLKLVHSFWLGDHWNFRVLNTLLPNNSLLKLQAIYLLSVEAALDNFVWNGS